MIVVLLAAGMITAMGVGSAGAATVSVAGTIPTVDGADIANDSGAADAGGDEGHMWGNRPHQGQSFVTGSNVLGYKLNAVTMKNRNNSVTNGPTFNVVVGTLTADGAKWVLTQIGSTETGVAPDYNTTTKSYITFTFDTPLTLNANTTYGFLWGSNGSGFVTANNLDDNTYTGGTALSSGDDNVPDLDDVLLRNVDRVFHLDLTVIPEPTTLALAAVGLLGLRRRRRS